MIARPATPSDRSHGRVSLGTLSLVGSTPATPRAGKIGDAYRYFVDRLSSLPAGHLADARQAVVSRLTFVSITLEGDDDPHLIFESLNAKGERLTQADLLRNYFLKTLPQTDADERFGRLWQPMQRSLGDDLTPFFAIT